MKTIPSEKIAVNIYNPSTGNVATTLAEVKFQNNLRRKRILSGEGLAKVAQKEVTVMTTDKTKHQRCCHYTSFQLRCMPADLAIEIYNADGCQKATLI